MDLNGISGNGHVSGDNKCEKLLRHFFCSFIAQYVDDYLQAKRDKRDFEEREFEMLGPRDLYERNNLKR